MKVEKIVPEEAAFVCLKLHFSKESKGFKPKQEMDLFGPPELFKNIFEGLIPFPAQRYL